jgi:hypothetical protein
MRRRGWIFWTAGTVAALALLFISVTFVCYRDWAFLCENTGSHMGYREWWFGLRTKPWHQRSAVEAYIQENYPDELAHRWTSYAGTGKNIYGGKLLHGHGRPGPLKHLKLDHLNRSFTAMSDTDKKAFYDLLVSADNAAIEAKVDSMMEALFTNTR